MTRYNPHTPDSIGCEWRAIYEDKAVALSPLLPFGARLESTATETIDKIWLYSDQSIGSIPEVYQVDVYEDGVFPSEDLTEVTAWPSADANISDVFTWNGVVTGNTNQYSFINQSTQTPISQPSGMTAADDFIYNIYGKGFVGDYSFDGLAAALAGKAITRVRLWACVEPFAWPLSSVPTITITPYLRINGTPYFGSAQTLTGNKQGGFEVVHDWYFNPATLATWDTSDLAAFDQGTATSSAGWMVSPTGSANLIAAVYQGALKVQHVGADVKVAYGSVAATAQTSWDGVPYWFPITMKTPGTGVPWAKEAAKNYRFTFRRLTSVPKGITLRCVAIKGLEDRAINGWRQMDVKHSADTLQPYEADLITGYSWAPGIVLEASGVGSVDSQPYIALDRTESPVFTGHELRQYFTTPGTLPDPTYELVRLVLGRRPKTATADVVVTVHLAAGDAQIGGTLTITPEDFEAADGGTQTASAFWKTYTGELDAAATLSTATAYYVKVVSSAATNAEGWRVQTLRNVPTAIYTTVPADLDEVTSGNPGETDTVYYDAAQVLAADAAIVVQTQPVAPTNFAAAATTANTDECIDYISLTWTATGLASSFERYEIQRRDTTTWRTIAHVISESIATFDDYESLRGTAADYRLRVVRTDEAVSEWTSTASATAVAPCCGYIFTSNEAPELSIRLDDVSEGEREIEWTQNVNVKQFYGRNYQVGFHELEDRGARFKRTLLVAADTSGDGTPAATTAGTAAFDDLFAITRPSHGGGLSYVCVHEETGDRWFATVLTPATTTCAAGGIYTADVEVIEVTNVPSIVTVEVEGS